ncbi:MAG TPA: 5'-3' exonuclease H3TH domain-containing protein [Polyangiaceae bacterium]|jgi:5'-3' exonuclease|nr:5'-3' exonuclease H3TH domain-containing protein [Polyangiaceae bacterium]
MSAVQPLQTTKRVALIDLSGIFRSAWHASEHDEISAAYNRTISKVVGYASGFDVAVVCCDRPPYKRKAISPEYKAHREKAPEAMHEQLRAVEAQLTKDGYKLVGSQGYEADDIIARLAPAATVRGFAVAIFSADKDLMQLVGPGVEVVSTATGVRYDAAAVREKHGVPPALIPDLLALMGDKSDGIPGIPSVGPKTAAKMLEAAGSLTAMLANPELLRDPRFVALVKEHREQVALSYKLALPMTDAPIDPEEIMQTKEPVRPTEDAYTFDVEPEIVPAPQGPNPSPVTVQAATKTETTAPKAANDEAKQKPEVIPAAAPNALVPVEWERALEPRDPRQAWGIAVSLYESRLFGDFPNPQAILAIVMTGRAYGMDTVASLRAFHLIKGKACPSAALLIGLVKRHPSCEWFRLVESTDRIATWETKRRGEPQPTRMSYSIEEAQAAGLASNDQYKKRGKTMLRWRSGVELARAVYSDVIAGLYSAEEMTAEP